MKEAYLLALFHISCSCVLSTVLINGRRKFRYQFCPAFHNLEQNQQHDASLHLFTKRHKQLMIFRMFCIVIVLMQTVQNSRIDVIRVTVYKELKSLSVSSCINISATWLVVLFRSHRPTSRVCDIKAIASWITICQSVMSISACHTLSDNLTLVSLA